MLSARLFDKILIANRGEIACRLALTARRLGISTVGVYSEADKLARHVTLCDEAVLLGGPTAQESYLKSALLLDVAARTGAQAIHPGYGFLSENAGFARACADANIVFVGPPAPAIDAMGSKSASKNIMTKAGVPCVPGYHGEDQSLETFHREAKAMGYPVLIKAIMGGGGKGMRIVRSPDELDEAMKASSREAVASFGDGRLLIEKYVEFPRHIEFQVFADTHGNVVHLFERDCSVQRRYQKVIEEAPAPGMTPELRAEMGKAACDAARAVNYVGAGTVEFIFDCETNKYYFMEMNTRLQVEHPVTEAITGQDLVEWQLRVASGSTLPKTQDELSINGHSFEARIYAENPRAGFLPHTGHLAHLRPPTETANVRVDTGVREGDDVSIYYDPMISKLITHDVDRATALRRLDTSLANYQVAGLPTNIEFLRRVATHPAFEAGQVQTGFIPDYIDDLLPPLEAASPEVLAAAAMFDTHVAGVSAGKDPLRAARFGMERVRTVTLGHAAGEGEADEAGVRTWHALRVRECSPTSRPKSVNDPRRVELDMDGTWTTAELIESSPLPSGGAVMRLQLGQQRFTATAVPYKESLHIFHDGHATEFVRADPTALYGLDDDAGAAGSLTAPMPGKVVNVSVSVGDKVNKGDAVMMIEAMKMEHVIRAPKAGVVDAVNFGPGDLVDEKTPLASIADE